MMRQAVFVHIPRTAGSSILETGLFNDQDSGHRPLAAKYQNWSIRSRAGKPEAFSLSETTVDLALCAMR